MLLALDTATGALGAAVLDQGRVLAEVTHQDSRRHGELLTPAVEQALAEAGATVADLSRIVVGVGPGPYTGLRVGIVTGLVLAQVRDLPVHGVCSLDALAEQTVAADLVDGPFLVATDARRKEVYWAEYAVGPSGVQRREGPGVARAADLSDRLRALPAVGRGPLLYDVLWHLAPHAPVDVSPGHLGVLAHRALDAGERVVQHPADGILLPPEPLYLRRPDATEPGPLKVVP